MDVAKKPPHSKPELEREESSKRRKCQGYPSLNISQAPQMEVAKKTNSKDKIEQGVKPEVESSDGSFEQGAKPEVEISEGSFEQGAKPEVVSSEDSFDPDDLDDSMGFNSEGHGSFSDMDTDSDSNKVVQSSKYSFESDDSDYEWNSDELLYGCESLAEWRALMSKISKEKKIWKVPGDD